MRVVGKHSNDWSEILARIEMCQILIITFFATSTPAKQAGHYAIKSAIIRIV